MRAGLATLSHILFKIFIKRHTLHAIYFTLDSRKQKKQIKNSTEFEKYGGELIIV